jgi:hypothetical protein
VTFGPEFSRELCVASLRLGVRIEWICAKINLETGETWNPHILQAGGQIVDPAGPNDPRPELFGYNGKRLSRGNGARGLFQMMPIVRKRPRPLPDILTLYPVTDPVTQLQDHVTRALGWLAVFRTEFKSREAYYCMNLAPARLVGGTYDDDTIIYSANPDDRPLNDTPSGASTYWPQGYRQNAAAFGKDKNDPRGRIRMRDLAVGLDASLARSRKRYDAELEGAYRANVA